MFKWIRKNRIQKLVTQARQFLESNYVEPEIEENIPVVPESPKKPGEPKVQFQVWGMDNYDSDNIDDAMSRLTTETSHRILEELAGNIDMTFVDKLLEHISKRHMRDSEVYKAAQVDRRLFSKIVSDREYKPAKDTCVAFALALRLTLEEAVDLLYRAGYTLSHSSKRDVIIEYFFKEKIYNLNDINDILYRLEQKVIGR